VLFVVELLQVPTAQDSQDQLDFGVDSHDSEVLTLTNHDETILCASKENQLLATHRITLRYMVEGSFVHRNRECVRVVHGDIAAIIKQAKLDWVAAQSLVSPALPPSFFAAAPPAPALIAAAQALLAATPGIPPATFAAAAHALPVTATSRKKAYTDSCNRGGGRGGDQRVRVSAGEGGGAGSPAKRVGAGNAGALVRMTERVEEDSQVVSQVAYELAEALGVQTVRHAEERGKEQERLRETPREGGIRRERERDQERDRRNGAVARCLA
jgi:hypothetical protein